MQETSSFFSLQVVFWTVRKYFRVFFEYIKNQNLCLDKIVQTLGVFFLLNLPIPIFIPDPSFFQDPRVLYIPTWTGRGGGYCPSNISRYKYITFFYPPQLEKFVTQNLWLIPTVLAYISFSLVWFTLFSMENILKTHTHR